MAKVTMPLASAKASGQLAKMMVFFPWKGINAVRGYVVPANPNTAGQQAQRSKLENAVDKFHDTALTAADKTAWNLFSTIYAAIMSGFNTFVKKFIDGAIAGRTWKKVWNCESAYTAAATADFTCDTDQVAEKLTLKYGESKTFMPSTKDATAAGGSQTFAMTGLVVGVTYFWQVYTDESADDCWSGINTYKHVAP